ncbi:MAG: lamin tail domain-containing protein [Myxococcota bacterium]
MSIKSTRLAPQFAALCLALFALAGCPADPPSDNGGGTDAGADADDCDPACDPESDDPVCGENETVLECIEIGGCAVWSEKFECPAQRPVCQAGACVEENSSCNNVCTPGSDPRCKDIDTVEECDDHDGDGCYEWGGEATCTDGWSCDPALGECAAPDCSDQCQAGATQCSEEQIQSCEEQGDGCLALSPPEDCPAGQACESGACVELQTCEDECADGDSLCSADEGRLVCRDDDGDGCLELVFEDSCPTGQECRNGSCVEADTCRDECVSGETVCVQNQIAECTDTDGDGCVEFTSPTDCGSGQSCSVESGTAQCQGAPTSGKVVINEIFYDAVGQDLRGGSTDPNSPVFIELSGPPGLDISGYVIELVNGSNGSVYTTVTLPADTLLDGRGFAVLTMDTPDTFLAYGVGTYANVYHVLPAYGNGTDALQNGQDNVVLEDGGGSVVDAVGYGDFSGTQQNFKGEGTWVSSATSGRSLGRAPGASDTDDNAADFQSYYPTPGLPNSDLIINEVYPDQPGSDDKTKTFVELVAPLQGWEDLPLDGYTLRAINGFDGQDYIFAGPAGAAGIDLSGANLNDGTAEDGWFVVCHDNANSTLASLCAVSYTGSDWQSGPDNVVLQYEGRTIDAVGYGTFSSGETFVGEGSPATYSRSDAGQSLGRKPQSDPSLDSDTDDNSVDFSRVSPTPGKSNPRP